MLAYIGVLLPEGSGERPTLRRAHRRCKARDASAPARQAARQRDRREPVDGEAGEAARLRLRHQAGELLALVAGQAAGAAAALAHELEQAAALVGLEQRQVVAREQGDLADREQLEHREPTQAGHAHRAVGEQSVRERSRHQCWATRSTASWSLEAVRSWLYAATRASPRRTSSSRSSASDTARCSSSATRATSTSASPSSSSAASPATSGMPPTPRATTGTPWSNASSTGMQKPSCSLRQQNTLAACQRSASSAALRWDSIATAPGASRSASARTATP